MKKILNCLVIISFLLIAGSLAATEMQSTGAGTTHQSDDLAVGDPYQGRNVSAAAEAGHPSTQVDCVQNTQDAQCVRAKQRQKSTPYWGGHRTGTPAPAQGSTTPAQ